MFNYNKRNLIFISLILTIIIYILIHIILYSLEKNLKDEKNTNLVLKTGQTQFDIATIDKRGIKEFDKNICTNKYKDYGWRIIISKINLNAPIVEGTNKENLRRGVGHFEQSSKWDGNICLAAHNRGYKYNYFQELKYLEKGDIILYQTDKGIKKYSVIYKDRIKETDLSRLEDTKENFITLITCAENMPEYRICVQAKEIISLV